MIRCVFKRLLIVVFELARSNHYPNYLWWDQVLLTEIVIGLIERTFLRGEFINADYNPGEKKTANIADVTNDGNYQWLIGTAGTNLWWTKHFRLSFNYTFNHVSSDKTGTQSIILHELGARAGFHF